MAPKMLFRYREFLLSEMKELGLGFFCSLTWLLSASAQAGLPLTTLFTFSDTNGTAPIGLVQSPDGSFYGTTLTGGASSNFGAGNGTVFQMAAGTTVKTVFFFDGTNGRSPIGVVLGADGNLYGATEIGGEHGCGSIYRLTPDDSLTTLFSFNGTNGYEPGMLTQARDGKLYGVTGWGGIGYTGKPNTGFGTLFKISTNGDFTTLVLFNGTNGSDAYGFPLIEGADGNLYGCTLTGGTSFVPTIQNSGNGTVFKVSPQGELTTLFLFSDTDCLYPVCIALGNNGDIYGTTQDGGTNHNGTVFRLSTNGVFTVLHRFSGGPDGGGPWCNFIRGQNGNFFGATGKGALGSGTVFEITTSGALTTLYSFTGGSDGGIPFSLAQGRDGLLYGATLIRSTIFRLAAPIGPVLPPQPDVSQADLAYFTVTNTATDLDIAANTVTYTLINPPAGAQIDSNGVITWTPTFFQSPSVNLITTVATDDGIPPLNATNSFTVTVSGPYDGIDLTTPAQALADLDGDGTPNLMEFALGTDPRDPLDGANGLVISTVLVNGNRHLSMKFKRRADDGGLPLLYIPEVSGDRQAWSSVPKRLPNRYSLTGCSV